MHTTHSELLGLSTGLGPVGVMGGGVSGVGALGWDGPATSSGSGSAGIATDGEHRIINQ